MLKAPDLGPHLHEFGFTSDETAQIQTFYELLWLENQKQNLTRLIEPLDFIDGHLRDVVALHDSGLLDYPALDLGSGAGVPGLISAILRRGRWFLVESEKMKALWLKSAVRSLGLLETEVYGERAEAVLKRKKVSTVIARAVGPVDRVFAWIESCSTWNSLVLLKGPKWEEEWKAFQTSRWSGRLQIQEHYDYTVGLEKKTRRIVKLARVPRGTIVANTHRE